MLTVLCINAGYVWCGVKLGETDSDNDAGESRKNLTSTAGR